MVDKLSILFSGKVVHSKLGMFAYDIQNFNQKFLASQF